MRTDTIFCGIPTRGTVHTPVIEAVMKNEPDYTRFTSNQGIPDCMNSLVNMFFNSHAQYLWVVEEDTVPPENALDEMLKIDQSIPTIVAIDYPQPKGNSTALYTNGWELQSVGLGCTLIPRTVFSSLWSTFKCFHNSPIHVSSYFRTDIVFSLNKKEWIQHPPTYKGYGGHDVLFSTMALQSECQLAVLPHLQCQHLRITPNNNRESNDGTHTISPLPSIVEHSTISVRLKDYPIPFL